MKLTAHNLEETQKMAKNFAEEIIPNSNTATVVGLYGELGAGKTSFTQGVAKSMGVQGTISSPTFVIEKIYNLENQKFTHLIHIDAYRIEKSEELMHLGWKDIISDPNNFILIEWPERISDIMPEHIKIKFSYISTKPVIAGGPAQIESELMEDGREIEVV